MKSLAHRPGSKRLFQILALLISLGVVDVVFVQTLKAADTTVSAAQGGGNVKTAFPENEPFRVTLELRDGSRVVGVPLVDSIGIQTSFAKVSIPLKQVVVIELKDDPGKAKLSLLNGDLIQGVLDLKTVRMNTTFGNVSIPLSNIERITARSSSIKRGLILYYSFDKDEGDIVTDQSGHDWTGKVHGAHWTPEGVKGGAMNFDGQGSIEVVDFTAVDNKYELTWGAWVFVTGSGLHGVMGKTETQDELFFLVIDNINKHFHASVVTAGRADGQDAVVKGLPRMNTWEHLMATYDGKRVKAYYNGTLVDSSAVHDRKPTNTNRVRAAIGDVAFGRGWRFQGKIDEVMILERCLTDAEVKQLYESQKPPR